MSIQVAALTAAFVLTKEARYAEHAAAHLRAWFVDPRAPHDPQPALRATAPRRKPARARRHPRNCAARRGRPGRELLRPHRTLSPDDLAAAYQWFADYLLWLGTDRTALLARDQKSHHGTSWLLQAAAYARLAPEPDAGVRKVPTPGPTIYDTAKAPNQYIGLNALRHQYKSVTLRAQLNADGVFMNELTSPAPYRNSLFNLDMLAGVCDLLSTRFETLWDYELQDGPGMRGAIAHHFPYIAHRETWPYAARRQPLQRPARPPAQPALLRPSLQPAQNTSTSGRPSTPIPPTQ